MIGVERRRWLQNSTTKNTKLTKEDTKSKFRFEPGFEYSLPVAVFVSFVFLMVKFWLHRPENGDGSSQPAAR